MRRNLVASIRLTASTGPLRAPDRFRIWRAGPNPGDYGELFFTPRSAESVMGYYLARGNAMVMDIEHALNPGVNPKLDPERPPPTAGYLGIELVDTPGGPELWGVPRWSDCGRDAPVPGEVCCAKHQIESGQRCYISPDWQIDTETREPLWLNRVSLVAEPGTFGVNLLASARASGASGGTMDEMDRMRAGYAAAQAMKGSADKKTAAAAETLCSAYEAAAATLGMSLADGTGQPAEDKKVAGDGLETPKDEKVEKVDEKPMATAAKTAARGGVTAIATGLTEAQVDARIAAAEERRALAALVTERMPKGSAGLVASMSLPQLRTAARELPVPKPADPGTGGDGGGNVTAGKGGKDPELSPEETFRLKRWRRGLEVKEGNMVAARAAWAADPVGGEVEVDIFAQLLRGPTGRAETTTTGNKGAA